MLPPLAADGTGVRLRAIQGDPKSLAEHAPPPLRRACGHVAGDPAIVRRGYRFYRGIGHELGGFLTRRFTLEDGRGASVTLLAGIDIETGAGVLERCGTTDDALYELTCGPGSVWAVVLTLENATISWRELNRKVMIGDPSAYGAFAAELTGLPKGAVPPVGALFGVPTIYDRSLFAVETVNFNAGSRSDSISMARDDLIRVGGGRLGSFST